MSLDRLASASLDILLGAAIALVGAVAWIFDLKGRVGILESQHEDIKDDVKYIRRRVDELADRDR
jgi:hypothetical protein